MWGKAELEDMLHLPKNDRILFTFFGISLVSKRKSSSTEIRFSVNNKNKLYRIFDDNPENKSILIREADDSKYPYSESYKDFETNPVWKEYKISEYHPLGLILNTEKYLAFVKNVGACLLVPTDEPTRPGLKPKSV